jgi:large subunit ribosomal protein L15
MNLSDLASPYGTHKPRKRIGRGAGSGHGKTSGFGQKGQKARTGHHKVARHFMGGQTPIQMQLPYKRGFKNYWRVPTYEVSLERLAAFDAGTVVTPDLLVEHRIIRDTTMPVVVLNGGDLTVALTVHAHRISKSAQAAIEAAGGSVQIIEESGTRNNIQPGRPGGPPAPKTERKTPISGS